MIYATLGNKEKRKDYDAFLANRNQFSVKLDEDEDDYGDQDHDEYELTEAEKRENREK